MKNMRAGFSLAVLATAILLLLQTVVLASAQDQDQDQGYNQDPPTRAGRISFVQGSVSFQPGGEGDWVEASQNRTLTVGDNLWVDRDSRAELQIGSTSIRLGPETSLTFLDLGNNTTQLRLSMGSVFFSVRHYGGDDAFEVDTPNLAFNLNRPGQFRLDVNENGDQTVASVFRGEAEITGSGNSYRLSEGQQGTFSGTDQLTYDVGEINRGDQFNEWAMSRDQREDRVRSREYVSDEMTGYEDLDDYGQWRNVEGYGNVWSPAGVPGDWAPYRYGHWVYVSPWGWTWTEDEPWGFAPFHYGRWAFVQSSWCWVPGPVAVAPVYSPALVAFVGGGGFSIGVGVGGGGGVGWFPLAPGEVFVPWYHTSPRYVENVNVTNTRVNVTQVTNVYNNRVTNITYVNQRNERAVTVVNHDTFVNARPVHNNIVRVDQREMQRIASAPVTHDVARNIQPERQSLVGSARPIDRRPPQQVLSRSVVATRQPVAMNRPAAIRGMERPAAPPPVRTVKAAPPTQAQPLERGAKGTGRPGGAMNEGASRPGAPENRPNATPRPGESENRPGQPENNRPGENNRGGVPRPGAPENRPGAQPNEAPRPGASENRPGQPENNRATRPENNRGAQPENNRGAQPENNRGVPRPPANNRPEPTPEQQRSAPNAQPERGRPAETPSAKPEQPSRPPDNRQETAPQREPNRPQAAPEQRQQQRSAPEARQPENQNRPEAAPRQQNRNENVPRPEAQPRGDNRTQEQRRSDNKENKDNKDNKDKNKPPQYR